MDCKIDLSGAAFPSDIHDRLVASLPLPTYYGRNLDALYDVLSEVNENWNITFVNCAQISPSLEDYLENMKCVFSDAASFGSTISVKWLESDE